MSREGFLPLGPAAAVAPSEERVLAVLGRKVLLRRAAGGGWSALELACRHQNADLTRAPRRGAVLTCPRHGWQYDLGSGACLNEPWAPLRRFEVREEDGTLWIAVGAS